MAGGPPPPPPPGKLYNAQSVSQIKLPQQNIPRPKTKMRTLQWQKIAVNKVVGKSNIWTLAGKMFNGRTMDYGKMEELFSISQPQQSVSNGNGSQEKCLLEKKKKENMEVNLLDGKRSLNVNIFLRQFRMPHEEIVRLLKDGQSEKFGAERLRALLKILPPNDEIEMLRSFDGDADKLGNAEKFFVCLLGVTNYKVRIEGMLLKEEFNTNMEWIRPSIDAVIEAAKDIKDNKELWEILYMVLIAGNYLNSGNYAGDAAGFKMSSLLKLTEIRANKPRMNLLHYVVMQAEETNRDLLKFPDDMKYLKDASKASIDNLLTDINGLATKLNTVSKEIGRLGDEFKNLMSPFLKRAHAELAEIKEDLKDIENLRVELSEFFCEEPTVFKLEECFKTLQVFCERFRKAIQENTQRKVLEEKAEARRRKLEAENARKNSAELRAPGDQIIDRDVNGDEGSIVDMLLADVRSGFANCKFGEKQFSITKVQKVQLDSQEIISAVTSGQGDILKSPSKENEDSAGFVRGGYGRSSMRRRRDMNSSSAAPTQNGVDGVDHPNDNRRSRQSQVSDSDDGLFDILMQQNNEQNKPEGHFERYGSLRRKRQERRERKGILDASVFERERAPSPFIDSNPDSGRSSPSVTTVTAEMRRSSDNLSSGNDASVRRSLRRTRSLMDKPTLDQVNADMQLDSTLSSVRRKFQEAEDRPESSANTDSKSSISNEETSTQRTVAAPEGGTSHGTSRWRSSVSAMETNPLPAIDEKSRLENTPELSEVRERSHSSIEASREKISNRLRASLDPSELNKVLKTVENSEVNTQSDPDHQVSVSVKTKLNRRWRSDLGKSDIDQVLKAIEDTGKQIEESALEPDKPRIKRSASNVESIASASDSGTDEKLTVRRIKRKQRSHLSMEDVHAALKHYTPEDGEHSSKETSTMSETKTPPKTPPVPPRRKSMSDSKSPNEDNKELSKGAKLAGKRRFRAERFGDKDSAAAKSSENLASRCRSNVEREEVDQAIKDLVSKNNMIRSKSCDDSMSHELSTCDMKNIKNRCNSVYLNSDGRRYGRYIPSDDSDSEAMHDMSPQSSTLNSDSPKNSSRSSIKSANTSTETLQIDNISDTDSSPKQIRKTPPNENLQITIDEPVGAIVSNAWEAGNRTNTGASRVSGMRRSYSGRDRTEATTAFQKRIEEASTLYENEDSPAADLAKWKQKREKQRMSVYDNVHDSSPRSNKPLISPRTDNIVSDIRSDVGSRSSYASSTDRDEGFESMSGTISQRTSMSSNLDAEFLLATPTFPRKHDGRRGKLDNTTDNTHTIKHEILPPPAEIIAGHVQHLSEKDTRKQRTESWTETVIASVSTLNKDSSLDSSVDYCATSPDSGHETMKEDMWDSHDDKSERDKNVNNDKKSEKNVPSYMRGTSSSSHRLSSVGTSKIPNKGRNARGSNLNKTASGSNTSLVSSVSTTSNISSASKSRQIPRRRISSASTTSNTSRPTTPCVSSPNSTPSSNPRRSTSSVTRTPTAPPTPRTPTSTGRDRPTTPSSSIQRTSSSSKDRPTTPLSANRTPSSGRDRPTTPSSISRTSSGRDRPTTPMSNRSTSAKRPTTPSLGNRPVTPSQSSRSVTPSVESNSRNISVTPEPTSSPLRRTQSMRASTTVKHSPVTTNDTFRPPASRTPSSTPRKVPSYMQPTSASKKKLDCDDTEEAAEERASQATDSSTKKTRAPPPPSPFTRHSSLRMSKEAADRLGYIRQETPSPSPEKPTSHRENKVGLKSPSLKPRKSHPESPIKHNQDLHVLETVDENSDDEGVCVKDSVSVKDKEKSPTSFLRRLTGKTKEKSSRKSDTDSDKSVGVKKKGVR